MATKPPSSTEAAPVIAKKAKSTAVRQPMSVIDLTCLGIIVLALLGTAYKAYTTSQTTIEVVVVATPTPTPTLTALELHQNHQRQGPQVTVDPNQVGKADPFQ